MAPRPAEQGNRYELDHGFTQDQAGDMEELRTLIDWFQAIEDDGGNTFHPSQRRIDENKAALRAAIRRLGADEFTAQQTVWALTTTPGRERQATSSVDEIAAACEAAADEGGPAGQAESAKYPAALQSPSAETEALAGEMAADPSLADAADNGHTDAPAEEGYEARRDNILYRLYAEQGAKLVGKTVAEPFTTLGACSHWLFARALAHGVNRIRGYALTGTYEEPWKDEYGRPRLRRVPVWGKPVAFEALLAEYFPKSRRVNIPALKRLSRQRRDVEIVRRSRVYTDYLTALEDPDGQRMLATLYAEVPGFHSMVFEMEQLYCDVVRATSPAVPDEELPFHDKPKVVKGNFKPYAQRIANVYRVTRSVAHTARAFSVRAVEMQAYLKATRLIDTSRRRGRRAA